LLSKDGGLTPWSCSVPPRADEGGACTSGNAGATPAVPSLSF
jgi:hypothetical protein